MQLRCSIKFRLTLLHQGLPVCNGGSCGSGNTRCCRSRTDDQMANATVTKQIRRRKASARKSKPVVKRAFKKIQTTGGERSTATSLAKSSTAARITTARASKIIAASTGKSSTPPLSQGRKTSKLTVGPSKQNKVLAMLGAPGGTTVSDIMKATTWQQHSVRGFLTGVVRKRLKLNLISDSIDGERRYWIGKAAASK